VEKVTKSQFAQTIPVSGKLQFAQTDEMTISATISGTVNFLQTYTNGTPVKKGGIICTVSSDNIIGGDPTKKIEVTYKIAQEELDRKERLLKEKIVTQSDYNTALENYEKARIEYESVLNSKANAGNTIKSPINGYVLETLVSNGDFVNAGDPIAKVVRNNKMMLVADVPLRYQNKLSLVKSATFVTEGSEEVFHTDSLEGKKLPCSTGVSTANAFITLRWEMNRTAGLWSGSFAKIYLQTETVSDAISIPVTALTDEGGTYYVYVKLDNNHYNKTRVKTGATDGKRIQIVEGLHAGNNVVTEGVMCVRQAGMSNIIGGHGHNH
jgi:RND family efflux transporter MFP subunit